MSLEEKVRKDFARLLKRARVSARFKSATAAAAALNVEAHAYRSWERGDAMPRLEMLEPICLLLDVDANYLLPRAWRQTEPPI